MKKILYSSLFLSILQSILFWHKSPGISIAIFLTATVVLIIYNLKEKEMIKNKKGLLWAIPIEMLGLTYFIYNNLFFKILNVPVILVLFVIMCMNITETKIRENRFIRQILNKIFKPFAVLFNFISDFDIDGFFEKQKENQNSKSEKIKKIGKSMLIAIPVILVIIVLLSSADSVFGSIFSSFTKAISKILEIKTINDLLGRCIVIAIAFIYISGFIIVFIKTEKQEKTDEKTNGIKFSDLTIKMLLVSLNIIYLLFSVIQFKYLFINAGRAADFDYATYARTGFFQLMFVSFINFALLHICKKNEENNKFLKIMLIIFTIIIVISAAFRMHLYEQEYGYTYLRLFVYFTLMTEILILIPILARIFGQKIDTFKTTIQIIVIMYVALNFININKIIARNNIDKYLTDIENESIDYYYLEEMTGTDSIEEQLRILNQSEDGLSTKAREYLTNLKSSVRSNLRSYRIEYGKSYKPSFAEWNLSKSRVESLLENVDLADRSKNYENNWK